MIATSPRPFVWFLPSLINLVPGVRVITPQLLKTVKAWPATRLSAVDKTCNEVTLFKNCGRFFEIFNVQTLLFLCFDKEVLKSQPGQPKTKLVSSPIMDNSVVPLYQFWLHDSGKDQTETTSSWLKFWKLNPEKLTLNPRSIRFLGNFITPECLRFPVYSTRNFHTICFKSFFLKFWRKDIAGEFVLCYRELFFFCQGIRQLPRRRGARATLRGKWSFTIHTCYIGPDWCSWVETEYQRGSFNRLSTLARFPFEVRYSIRRYRDENNHFRHCHVCMTYANLPMTLTGTCNSTDERPGLKSLLRNWSQNTALLFIIFWKFPYFLH